MAASSSRAPLDPFRQLTQASSPTTERSFETRQIRHFDRLCFIVLQDANGPCPLIAVFNVLSLRGHVALRLTGSTRVTLQRIVHAIGNFILERSSFEQSTLMNHSSARHQEYANNDAFESLPSMYEGMNVNPRFRHIEDFEPTAPLSVFECVRIRLLHGWLLDPVKETSVGEAIGARSYNQLMSEAAQDPVKWESSATHAWLTQHATQLTPFGLERLMLGVAEQELGILFRNNHFHVVTKQMGCLFLLVTDEVLSLSAASPVWQSLVGVSDANAQFIGPFVPQYIPQPGAGAPTSAYAAPQYASTQHQDKPVRPVQQKKRAKRDRGETCACAVQ